MGHFGRLIQKHTKKFNVIMDAGKKSCIMCIYANLGALSEQLTEYARKVQVNFWHVQRDMVALMKHFHTLAHQTCLQSIRVGTQLQPFGNETGIFQDNLVNSKAADIQGPNSI